VLFEISDEWRFSGPSGRGVYNSSTVGATCKKMQPPFTKGSLLCRKETLGRICNFRTDIKLGAGQAVSPARLPYTQCQLNHSNRIVLLVHGYAPDSRSLPLYMKICWLLAPL
jgi:hypothetical protein